MEEDMSYVTEIDSRSIFEIASSGTNRFRAFFRQRQAYAVTYYGIHAWHMPDAVQRLGFARRFFKKSYRTQPHPGETIRGVFLWEKHSDMEDRY